MFLNKSMYWWLDQFGILKVSSNSFLGKVIQKKGDPIFGFELREAIKRKEIFLIPRVMNGVHNEITFKEFIY